MQDRKNYKNGQKIYEVKNELMVYFYQNGVKKAEGPYVNEMMEGDWRFYDQEGRLIQIGHFLSNEKHGNWTRYDQDGTEVYAESFVHGLQQKKK